MKTKPKKIYIVVTCTNDSDCDMYSDIIGVYANNTPAENIAEKLTQSKPIKGIDYNALQPFDKAAVLVFNLGQHINNKD